MKKNNLITFFVLAMFFAFPVALLISEISRGANVPVLFVLPFAFVDLLIWIVFFVNIVRIINGKRILKNGKEFTASFVSFGSNVEINKSPIYFVSYVWENEQGEKKHGKSGSEYTLAEVEAFEIAKTFKIKAVGNKSVIVSNPSLLIADQNTHLSTNGKRFCEYCNGTYDETANKCPWCGATRDQ